MPATTIADRLLTWGDTDDHGHLLIEWTAGSESFTQRLECTPTYRTRNLPVVYAILGPNNEVRYIGVSNDPLRRLNTHALNHEWARGQGVTAAWTERLCCTRHAMQYERHMQRALRPTHNRLRESVNR